MAGTHATRPDATEVRRVVRNHALAAVNEQLSVGAFQP